MRLLGGIGGFKKVTHGATTPFGAFCAKKLNEMNYGVLLSLAVLLLHGPYVLLILGKEIGHKTTLPEFLMSYSHDEDLKQEYKDSDKKTLLADFDDIKKARESVPKKLSNVAISKAVTLKMDRIISYVCPLSFLDAYLTSF